MKIKGKPSNKRSILFASAALILLLIISGIRLFSTKPSGDADKSEEEKINNSEFLERTSIDSNSMEQSIDFKVGSSMKLNTYCISMKKKSFNKISEKRAIALENGVLLTADDDLVNGELAECGEDKLDIEFRLKGDWVDHLKHENKWSFRVIMKNQKTMFGMRKFSFQHPKSRNYLWEWLFQKTIKKAGVIALRYDFCNLVLNIEDDVGLTTKNLGIMAVEESFDKILIEHNKRREGIIIGFDESILWKGRERDRHYGIKASNDIKSFLKQATIKVYNQNKVLSDPKLLQQFNIAKGMLDGLRKNEYEISEVFDIDKLTTYTAISNLFGAHHGLISHNLRIYYNPITNKLEPIGFDANGGKRLTFIRDYMMASGDAEYEKMLLEKLLLFSDASFIQSLLQDDELKMLVQSLGSEFDESLFKPEILEYNSNFIKNEINPADVLSASLIEKTKDTLVLQIQNLTKYNVQLTELKTTDGKKLNVGMDKSLISANERKTVRIELNPHFENAFVSKKNKKGGFRFPKDVEKLVLSHEVYGVNISRTTHINPYTSHVIRTDNMSDYKALRKSNIEAFEFIQENADSVVFKSGKHTISKSIVVNEQKKLHIESGFELNLTNGASLISYSEVNFNGTRSAPIIFHSSDSTGQGIFITNASEGSRLNYCEFDNLSNPQLNGWSLSGAVNFHESDVSISNCTFYNNRCEDYLNIIRSKFLLTHSSIENSMSDAFDGDFVTGKIENSEFINCGNDGIDVSGSELHIENVIIDNPADKAISAGEASSLTGNNIEIYTGEIGVVCKDLSKVELNNTRVDSTRLVAAVFQKKPEYGAGEIHLENLAIANYEKDYLIEDGSILTIDKTIQPSNSEDVTKFMYGKEYGKSSK